MTNTVLFPSDPLNERRVDPEFAREWDALRYEDVTLALIDQDALANSGEVRCRNLPDAGRVLYRGWMLSPERYRSMSAALITRGLTLVTGADQYRQAHHLPQWFDAFAAVTPRTVVVPVDSDAAAIMDAARTLGAQQFVIKDFVKSRKHEWDTAAFAPTVEALPAIVAEFKRLQDDFIVGGIVIREFLPLDKSRPEYRVWWTQAGGARVASLHPDYPAEAFVVDQHLLNWLDAVVQPLVVASGLPFIVTDVAATAAGGFVVIEVGDGQVSGMPQDLLTTVGGEGAYADLIVSALTSR